MHGKLSLMARSVWIIRFPTWNVILRWVYLITFLIKTFLSVRTEIKRTFLLKMFHKMYNFATEGRLISKKFIRRTHLKIRFYVWAELSRTDCAIRKSSPCIYHFWPLISFFFLIQMCVFTEANITLIKNKKYVCMWRYAVCVMLCGLLLGNGESHGADFFTAGRTSAYIDCVKFSCRPKAGCVNDDRRPKFVAT